jgi:NAD(P)-dependent dehydrogenase (short-subunit alcohol dehydrogenase family)
MAVYLITGASSGIGAAMTRLLCERGQTVYGLARRAEKLAATAQQYPGRFFAFPCDVTRHEDVKTVCAQLPQVPDVSILCAGIGDFDPPEAIDLAVHQRTFATNYFGALHIMTELYPRVAQRGFGKFVAISSLAGYRGLPGAAAYCASKAAVSVLMESFRVTYGRKSGIEFLVVHPGFVATPMTAKNKDKMPFLWSAEKAADYILTGIESNRLTINFPLPMRIGMGFLRFVPAGIYRRAAGLKK